MNFQQNGNLKFLHCFRRHETVVKLLPQHIERNESRDSSFFLVVLLSSCINEITLRLGAKAEERVQRREISNLWHNRRLTQLIHANKLCKHDEFLLHIILQCLQSTFQRFEHATRCGRKIVGTVVGIFVHWVAAAVMIINYDVQMGGKFALYWLKLKNCSKPWRSKLS